MISLPSHLSHGSTLPFKNKVVFTHIGDIVLYLILQEGLNIIADRDIFQQENTHHNNIYRKSRVLFILHHTQYQK